VALNRDTPRVEPELDAEPNPVFAKLTGKIRVPGPLCALAGRWLNDTLGA
jgi:hypothetical protein